MINIKKNYVFTSVFITTLIACTSAFSGTLVDFIKSSSNDSDIASLLAHCKKYRNNPDEFNLALRNAAARGLTLYQREILRHGKLIQGFDVNSTSSNGRTAYLWAVFYGREGAARDLFFNCWALSGQELNVFADSENWRSTTAYKTAIMGGNKGIQEWVRSTLNHTLYSEGSGVAFKCSGIIPHNIHAYVKNKSNAKTLRK